MMKLNKLILVLIVVLAMCLVLAACSNPPEEPEDPGDGNTEEQGDPDQVSDWWDLLDVAWEEHNVDLDTGINMTYQVMGPEDGVPIILIHGATDSRVSWSQVAPILAETYRVYVPELRGHGKTDKPEAVDGKYLVSEHTADILSFMDKVGLEKANIAGHSLGSFITQDLAITAPDKVSSISLIASAAKLGDMSWIFEGDGEEFLGLNGYADAGALPDDFIRSWTATTNEDPNFAEATYLHAAQLPYLVWGYVFGGAAEYDNLDNLDQITCPVLIVWGTNDDLIGIEAQQDLQAGLTNAADVNYVEIEGASHNTHWDSQAIAAQVAGLISDVAVE